MKGVICLFYAVYFANNPFYPKLEYNCDFLTWQHILYCHYLLCGQEVHQQRLVFHPPETALMPDKQVLMLLALSTASFRQKNLNILKTETCCNFSPV